MAKDIKEAIKECITVVNSLSESVDEIHERAISELPEKELELFIHLMDLRKTLWQSKGIVEKIGWCLNK